jgi:hypothetical protein
MAYTRPAGFSLTLSLSPSSLRLLLVRFSYHPEEFMDRGLFYYNYGFVDMHTPSLGRMVVAVSSPTTRVCSSRSSTVCTSTSPGESGSRLVASFV